MLDVIQERWDDILYKMKEEYDISDVAYKTWLIPLKVIQAADHKVTIVVPESSFISLVKKKYTAMLQVTIEEDTGYECSIDFISSDESARIQTPLRHKEPAVSYLPTQDPNLTAKYTFDTFVVGSNNKMAHAACLAVAESPGEVYNPLFIYGGVGLGKTHLMNSIANFILKNNPKAKVTYVTSEQFMNEVIESIKNKNTSDFREKYRNIDVLLIDDIQFIQGKESTVEEFFHTFNALHLAKKQIIISSDRSPKELVNLEDRLVSRFEWGLTVDIQSPDYETRMAILRKKEELEGYNIDNEVIKYIATYIKSNIRELEGALTKVVAMARLNNTQKPDLALAEEALKDMISPDRVREITPEVIISTVAEHFGLRVEDLASTKRNRDVVNPRQIAMYLCRELTTAPLALIGSYMGGRDHTTIMHGIEKVADSLDRDENLRSTIEILKKKINPT